MYLDLAGGGDGAQVGAREDVRILDLRTARGIWEQGEMYMGLDGLSGRIHRTPPRTRWRSVLFDVPNTISRLQHFGYKTQDSIMQDIGDRS